MENIGIYEIQVIGTINGKSNTTTFVLTVNTICNQETTSLTGYSNDYLLEYIVGEKPLV